MGSQKALAKAIGREQGHVWYWLNRAKKGVPPEMALAIERVTHGAVTRHDLLPSIYPEPMPPLPQATPAEAASA